MATAWGEGRWNELQLAIRDETGVPAGWDAWSYYKIYGGRKHFGIDYFISYGLPSGDWIEIHDAWLRRNPDGWIGWLMWVEGQEGIERRRWPITKEPSEVVAAFNEALSLAR